MNEQPGGPDGAADASADEVGVEDPEALRRAERAVARERPEAPRTIPPSNEAWVPVLTEDVGGTATGELLRIAAFLESNGIDYGWDPRDPRTTSMDPYAVTAPARTSIVVPASQVQRVREAVGAGPPSGISWTGPATEAMGPQVDAARSSGAPGWAEPDVGAPSATSAGPRGMQLSDNARIARGAGKPSAVGRGTLVLIAVVVIAALVLFLVLRG